MIEVVGPNLATCNPYDENDMTAEEFLRFDDKFQEEMGRRPTECELVNIEEDLFEHDIWSPVEED